MFRDRLVLICLVAALQSADAGDFAAVPNEVQTILDRHCIKCHGPLDQNAGLRLDSATGLWQGSAEGPVVVAGNPESSKLVRVLTPDADPHMPPKKQLQEADIAKLRDWIKSAATTTANESRP